MHCRGTTSHPTKGCLIQAPEKGLQDAPNYFIYVQTCTRRLSNPAPPPGGGWQTTTCIFLRAMARASLLPTPCAAQNGLQDAPNYFIYVHTCTRRLSNPAPPPGGGGQTTTCIFLRAMARASLPPTPAQRTALCPLICFFTHLLKLQTIQQKSLLLHSVKLQTIQNKPHSTKPSPRKLALQNKISSSLKGSTYCKRPGKQNICKNCHSNP